MPMITRFCVDTFLSRVIDQLRDKKAIVIYAARPRRVHQREEHLHGTPRKLAPPEQFPRADDHVDVG